MYYVYIVRCSDFSLYTGITTDIKRRMNEHFYRKKEAANYTKARQVEELEAVWLAQDRSSASKLEYKIKHLSKDKKEELIKQPSLIEGYEVFSHQSMDTYVNKK